MKIGSTDPSQAVAATSQRDTATPPTDKVAASAAPPEASTQVALSPAAALLVGDSSADFDAEKVARLAQAIRDGKFEVNAEAIADKLIGHAQELLARPSH